MTPAPSPLLSPNPNAAWYDTPFIYSKVYSQASASPISGVTGQYPDVIKSDGDSDFFLRRAANITNFKNAAGQTFVTISPSGIQTQATAIGDDYPVAPEKLYPIGTDIPILLTRTNGVITPTVASLDFSTAFVNIANPIFQGVKRRKGKPNTTPNYKYRDEQYTYVLPFTQNWTYLTTPYASLNVAAPRTFTKTVLNWDFELQALEVSGDFDNNATGQSTYAGFMLKLYDANGYALMNDFVHYRWLSYCGGFTGNTKTSPNVPGDTLPWHPNCFPVPPIIYPAGGTIRIDVVSLLDSSATNSTAPSTLKVQFRGMNRVPC